MELFFGSFLTTVILSEMKIDRFHIPRCKSSLDHMTSGTISLTLPKLKYMEEGLVNPH